MCAATSAAMNTCWRSPAKVVGSVRHATRKRCRCSALCLRSRSWRSCRIGISRSRFQRCCGRTFDFTADYSSNSVASRIKFRARVIAFLVEAGLLPADRARMLRGWVHSGFQVHQSRRIAAHECQDIERLAQYIVRNPFSIAKMQVNRSGDSILYRSGMNAKIKNTCSTLQFGSESNNNSIFSFKYSLFNLS